MNYNKRFAAFIAAAMLTAGSLSTTAAETPYCHTIGNVTVSFDEGTMIPYDRQELAAQKIFELCGVSIAESENTISTKSVLCTLFGHDKKVSTSISMMHKVYATQPRCRKITYEVTTCSRCTDYAETVVVQDQDVYCCPND